LPIDVLKIDQSFIHGISVDSAGSAIVSAVISMGLSLGHRLIAEGVETREQVSFLQAQHCGEGQGYYFSRPIDAAQLTRMLESDRSGLSRLVDRCRPVATATPSAAGNQKVTAKAHRSDARSRLPARHQVVKRLL